MTALPDLYFRVRDNGAQVFRVTTDSPTRRLEMTAIAVVNVRNGEIRPQGKQEPTEEELAEITAWRDARADILAIREDDEIRRSIDQINMVAHWAQSRATDRQLDEVTDDLLLAMHDLRSVLVRKRADRMEGG